VSTASSCENVILLIPEIIPNPYIQNFRTVCKDTYECQKVNGEDKDDDERPFAPRKYNKRNGKKPCGEVGRCVMILNKLRS